MRQINGRVRRVERASGHNFTSSPTASVTAEMSGGRLQHHTFSSRWPWISGTLKPRAYSEMILSSNPDQRASGDVPPASARTCPDGLAEYRAVVRQTTSRRYG